MVLIVVFGVALLLAVSAEASDGRLRSRVPGSSSRATPRSSATASLASSSAAAAASSTRRPRSRRARNGAGSACRPACAPRRTPELHQPGDRVQLVVELVGLRAQGVGDRQVRAELALQRISSVRSRSVVTLPIPRPLAEAARRLNTTTRVPTSATASWTSASGPASRSTTRGSSPRSATGRPTGSPCTSRVARAASFIIVTRPSVPTATTPSRMLCSSASRWSASPASSVGASPRVRRFTTRETT